MKMVYLPSYFLLFLLAIIIVVFASFGESTVLAKPYEVLYQTEHAVKASFGKNSELLQSWKRKWISDWQKFDHFVFTAVVDDKYLAAAVFFVKSLYSFGYSLHDLELICISSNCQKTMIEHHIPHVLCIRKDCQNDRCLVSDAKMYSVLQSLKNNRMLFVFDLDVFMIQDPLSAVEPRATDLVIVQKDVYTKYNFGCFLIKPDLQTVEMFSTILTDYRKSNNTVWDQELFSKYMVKNKLPLATFNEDAYINYIFVFHEVKKIVNYNNVTLAHMTCFDGAYSKRYSAFTMFGNYNYYNKFDDLRTISSRIQRDFTVEEHNLLLNILASLASETSRQVRLFGPAPLPLYLIYNPDKVMDKYNTFMVPATWWDRYPRAHSFRRVKFRSSSSEEYQRILHFLKKAKSVDDIQLEITREVLNQLKYGIVTAYENKDLLCKLFPQHLKQKPDRCGQMCEGIIW